jgi:hypothetical protein
MLFREVGTFFMMFVIYRVSETLHIHPVRQAVSAAYKPAVTVLL